MNISIEWPQGRRDAQHHLDETCELTVCMDGDDLPCDSDVLYPTTANLAQSRKREWPGVNPLY